MLVSLRTVRLPDGSFNYNILFPYCEITVYADVELSKQALTELARDMADYAFQNDFNDACAIVDSDGVCISRSGF